jgi:hypothetical protein
MRKIKPAAVDKGWMWQLKMESLKGQERDKGGVPPDIEGASKPGTISPWITRHVPSQLSPAQKERSTQNRLAARATGNRPNTTSRRSAQAHTPSPDKIMSTAIEQQVEGFPETIHRG